MESGSPDPDPDLAILSRRWLPRLFFFGVFLFLIYHFLRLLAIFVAPITVAAALGIIFYPLHRFWSQPVPRPNLTAALSTWTVLLLAILPVAVMSWFLLREADVVLPAARAWLQGSSGAAGTGLPEKLAWSSEAVARVLPGWQSCLDGVFLSGVEQASQRLTTLGTQLLKNMVFVFFQTGVMIVSLFFCFRDGLRMMRVVADLVPMTPGNQGLIMENISRTLIALTRGVFITAAAQGILAGIGFLAVGVRFPILFAFATGFLAMVPFLGAALVWLPIGIYTAAKVSLAKGIFVLAWGALVVSLVDNLLRPILIGREARLPVLLLFFAIVGGLKTYGFEGMILGPLILVTVLTFVRIYREQYRSPTTEG
ncbi:MAG: AI-2E family transporter [Elusimicrobiota bacterium]|jgi:predicted PurR-regulated permease PerM